jgi:hypothetical protein
MMRRINLRLTFGVLLLLGGAAAQLAKEHRPSMLRPGLHLYAYVANTVDGSVTVVDLVRLAVGHSRAPQKKRNLGRQQRGRLRLDH